MKHWFSKYPDRVWKPAARAARTLVHANTTDLGVS